MSISISLNREVTFTDKGTVKLALTVTATDIDSAIFAIEVFPRSADALAPLYRFSHVCSPAELVEFPDEEAEDNCYFRVSNIEMIFDNSKYIDIVLKHITKDINFLVSEYKQLEDSDGVSSTITFN